MRKIKFISILLVLSMLLTVPAFAFSTGFTDVSEKATYAESVSYLADAGILRGTASGRFAPNEKITVSQWATMLCRAFDTEPEGVSWQEVGANAVQIAVHSSWLDPTAVGDENGFICRGELYRTVFAAAGIPLYDATLYSLDWLSPGENALRVGKKLGLCAENKTAAELVTRAEAAQLLHAVLTQNLTVTPPDTPVTVENLIQWNVDAFLLELRKVPQPILDQLYLSALKNLLISKGKVSPLKEIVFIPTGGVKGIKATSAILSGVNEVKPPVLIDGDKPGVKMANELKADFYAADTDKLIMVTDFSSVPEAEVEDLLPKAKLAKVIARFLPRPEDTDEEFDDVVVDNKPICNQIEEFAKAQGIDLGGKGWKVRLAAMVKREILKGTDKVICESDPEFAKILELFNRFS